MQKLIINGGKRLRGEITVQGAKNAALPILAASVLCGGEVVLHNCPRLSDVYSAMRILTYLGCGAGFDGTEKNTVTVNTSVLDKYEISDKLMREMRSSIFFLGALVGRTGRCRLSFPGGCDIGRRPIDIHISALRKMGVTVNEEYGCIDCLCENRLKGAKIPLSFPSVGATENIILAAVLAEGTTEITNAAREPEIACLAEFLNRCGADIRGAGSSTVVINGVSSLHGCEFEIMPDRIAAATYLACTAAAGGEIIVKGCVPRHLDAVNAVFEQSGCSVHCTEDSVFFGALKPLKAVDIIRTMVYPGFPTDCQAFVMAALCRGEGTSVFVENIFENRYSHTEELRRMGADIRTEGKVAVVTGVKRLYGAKISAPDLRGGAGLAAAALSAEGTSEISGVCHIDRGYEDIEGVLSSLGADIRRI
ncbi:MAG: UDP-N-acetylglucosamine 1-carboxyvinyltransferase [Oscillospiraceae bacterium]|nr:UDP-N-acetylglucosamine 1-carboxyvinyltransferase [Oscillospiraceae bacterium]